MACPGGYSYYCSVSIPPCSGGHGERPDFSLEPVAAEPTACRARTAVLLNDADLKRAPIGPNLEDYDVLVDGIVVGRILFVSAAAAADRQWMWASAHNGDIRSAAHRYSPKREAAMAAFAKSWRRE